MSDGKFNCAVWSSCWFASVVLGVLLIGSPCAAMQGIPVAL